MPFRDRSDAGIRLAERLREYANRDDCVIVALPRGGVPVAYEIAQQLNAPLDVRLVRKIGAPAQPEFAIGAIASGGIELLNPATIRALHLLPQQVKALVARERAELNRRESALRGEHPALSLSSKTAVVVDDGLATGSTMRAAIAALRTEGVARIVVALPVAAASAAEGIGRVADDVVCLETPEDFEAVSQWYRNFDQVSDAEVRELLARSRASSFHTRL